MGPSRAGGIYHGVAVVSALGLLALPGLGSLGSSTPAAPTPAQWRAMGHLSSGNAKLRSGCHKHTYHYRITPPSSQWALETFLTDPKGKHLASDVILSGADKKSGTKSFTICKSNTRTGTFTIKGKLTYEVYPDEHSGWITPTHFKLSKP